MHTHTTHTGTSWEPKGIDRGLVVAIVELHTANGEKGKWEKDGTTRRRGESYSLARFSHTG